jgi:hypothetical protein
MAPARKFPAGSAGPKVGLSLWNAAGSTIFFVPVTRLTEFVLAALPDDAIFDHWTAPDRGAGLRSITAASEDTLSAVAGSFVQRARERQAAIFSEAP